MSPHRIPRLYSHFVPFLAVIAGAGASLAPGVAHGAVSAVTATSSKPTTIGGKAYLEVTAMMDGDTPAGTEYSVPITLLYPEDPAQCNGTGIVDVLNDSALYAGYIDFCQVQPFWCDVFGLLPPVALG